MDVIRKEFNFQVRQVGDPEERILEFIGSTSDVDRYGDVIEVEGWDFKHFMSKGKGPFLWAHDYKMPPVGVAKKVNNSKEGLSFQVYFPTLEEIGPTWPANHPTPDCIYRCYLNGLLKATSVGFRDFEREPITDKEGKQSGWRFKKQELYELSAVPVPANPQAVIMALQKGVVSPEEVARLSGVPFDDGPGREDSTAEVSEITDPAEPEGEGAAMSLLALVGLMEDLQVKIDELAARVAEPRPPQVDPAQLKSVIRETLEEFFQAGPMASDYYSLALNPGLEPHGGRPAGELDINGLLAATQQLHQTVKGGTNHGS